MTVSRNYGHGTNHRPRVMNESHRGMSCYLQRCGPITIGSAKNVIKTSRCNSLLWAADRVRSQCDSILPCAPPVQYSVELVYRCVTRNWHLQALGRVNDFPGFLIERTAAITRASPSTIETCGEYYTSAIESSFLSSYLVFPHQ